MRMSAWASSGFAAVKLSKIVSSGAQQSGVASGKDTKPLASSITDRLAVVGDDPHHSA